jgi:UDP-glucose 4-epimerase
MKKSLVTGGCGFIGSHLVDALIAKGQKVYVIDDLSSECNEEFYYNNEAVYLHEDIKNYDKIEGFFKNIDYVFHLAAESRIQPTLNRPQETCMTNFVGTCNVLEASKNSGVSRFFYSGTSSAYGRKNSSIAYKILNKPCELRESMPTDCLNPYSVSKVAAEDLCKIYSSLWGLNTITFRYFNVYGERQPTKGKYAPVIGLFMKQKNENKPMTIVGDGKQRRDFTHVSDIVKANILAMESEDITGVSGEIFNVGTGINHSILEIASMIGGEVEHLPPRLGEAQQTLADISKISHSFDYQPSVRLEDWISKNK